MYWGKLTRCGKLQKRDFLNSLNYLTHTFLPKCMRTFRWVGYILDISHGAIL